MEFSDGSSFTLQILAKYKKLPPFWKFTIGLPSSVIDIVSGVRPASVSILIIYHYPSYINSISSSLQFNVIL